MSEVEETVTVIVMTIVHGADVAAAEVAGAVAMVAAVVADVVNAAEAAVIAISPTATSANLKAGVDHTPAFFALGVVAEVSGKRNPGDAEAGRRGDAGEENAFGASRNPWRIRVRFLGLPCASAPLRLCATSF